MNKEQMSRIRHGLGVLAGEGGARGRAARDALNALDGDEVPMRRVTPAPSRPPTRAATPTLGELESGIAKLEAETPKGRLLAARPDLSPAVLKGLRQMPLDVVRSFLDAHPAPATPLPTLSSASSGVGVGFEARRLDPDALREIMGLPSQKPVSSFDGVRQELRTLTREEAQAVVAARAPGGGR